jgi:hypothetical protein
MRRPLATPPSNISSPGSVLKNALISLKAGFLGRKIFFGGY